MVNVYILKIQNNLSPKLIMQNLQKSITLRPGMSPKYKENKFMRTHDGNHKGKGAEETDIWVHGKKEMKGEVK